MEDGDALEKSLGDDAKLDVAMVGGEFPAHLIALGIGFPMRMLVAGTARPGFHGRHPEMITVGSNGVDRLFERHFDFESHAVELDDLDGRQRKIRTQQDLAAPLRMDDQDEPDANPDWPPQEIHNMVAEGDIAFPIDGAGRFGKQAVIVKKLFKLHLASVETETASARKWRLISWFISDRVGFGRSDKVLAGLDQGQDDFGRRIIGVCDQVGGSVDAQ